MRRMAAHAHRNPVHVQRLGSGLIGLSALLLLSTRALAQEQPPTAGFPSEQGPAPGTAPPPPSGPPPAVPTQAPAPAPPPASPQPGYAAGAPPQNEYTPPPNDREMRPSPRGNDPPIEEPLPPPPPEEKKGGIPPFSIRIDPFTWLIEGHLQFELEMGVLKWLSVEVAPSFVTNDTPPALSGFTGRDDSVRQESNGPGALSGVTLDAGFWLSGKALHGYVLRAMFATNGYTYRSYDGATKSDEFVHTERVLMGMFGSNSTWGIFTIAGGIGLGVDLNSEKRCISDLGVVTHSGCNDLQLGRNKVAGAYTDSVSVASFAYPVVLAARISLGVTID